MASKELLLQRFVRQTRIQEGCWEWLGKTNHGYAGNIQHTAAYRWIYELINGPVHELAMDHLCCNTLCVRPDHLEPVTRGENVRRALLGSTIQRCARAGFHLRTHCKQGHDLAAEGTYTKGGQPTCRRCALDAAKRCRQKRQAA